MKWTERWIARAQRKADARADRFLRHEEGVRAGTEPPSLGGMAAGPDRETVKAADRWNCRETARGPTLAARPLPRSEDTLPRSVTT